MIHRYLNGLSQSYDSSKIGRCVVVGLCWYVYM